MAITIINPIVNLFADMQGGSGASGGIAKNSCILSFNVEEIPNYAFKDNRYLTTASLAKNMKTVGVQGFMNCPNLEVLTIPASIKEIQSKAFANCKSLSQVIFEGDPSKLKISADAFNGCTSLSWFDEDDTETVKNIGGLYFLSDKAVISGSEVILGNTGNWVYTSLDYVNIPDQAFKNAIGLTDSHFKNNTQIIGIEAYRGCDGLVTVTIPNSINTIKSLAFANCKNLELVNFSGDASQIDIAINAFQGCPKLSFFELGDNFWKNIGKKIYYLSDKTGDNSNISLINNKSGTWIYLKNNEYNVSDYAFKGADGLTEIIIDQRATTIGKQAFMETNLTTITIPALVKTIKSKAFANCQLLESVNFSGDASLIDISPDAFDGCIVLSWFSNNDLFIKNIGGNYYVSDKGSGLNTEILDHKYGKCAYFKNDYANIPKRAYKDVIGLTNAGIKANTQIIDDEAYFGCTGLTSVGIPGQVSRIGKQAFKNCSNISVLMFNQSSTLKRIEEEAFANCINLVYTILPPGLEYLADTAFNGCPNFSFFNGEESSPYIFILNRVYLSDKGDGSHIIINNTEVSIK